MLTLVLSGPADRLSVLRTTLANEGYEVVSDSERWTLSDGVSGEDPGYPVAFLTLRGPDHARAIEIASQFRWVLRSHWEV